jgi:hypothetical protein
VLAGSDSVLGVLFIAIAIAIATVALAALYLSTLIQHHKSHVMIAP